MRIGTFMCWLFGHCFLKKISQLLPDAAYQGGYKEVTKWSQYPYCIRCGIDKPTVIKGEKG